MFWDYTMKLKMSAFLMKAGVERTAILAKDAEVTRVVFELEDTSYDFYWHTSQSVPKWLALFSGVDGIELTAMRGRGIQGLLVLERQGRIFCFTFGHARHLVEQLLIERYFGLKVALSMSDPDLIKSIDKSNIDKAPLRSRSQSSQYISISQFEFRFDWEILKSLTGIVDSETTEDHEYEVVTGSDSVSIFTEISLKGIPVLADRLLTAYSDDGYKEKYPWIDYIVPVRDGAIITRLDALIVGRINASDFDNVWIAPPQIIEYRDFSGYCYKHRHTKSFQVTYPDMHLEQCLADKKMTGSLDIQHVKSTQIFLYGGDDQQIGAWSLYLCLNGEVELDGNLFILNEGDWYQVERDFCAIVSRHFDELPRSTLALPPYAGRHEGPYLAAIADDVNLFLMDKKLVKPDGAASSIEFCDLLTQDYNLVHVKKYSSSSVLGHLFSQAYVSAETLLHSPDILAKIDMYLPEGVHFEFDVGVLPRRSKIILAIMQERAGEIHMPFFSKVNLRQYSRRLKDMGFDVELLKIPY
jgi:uncharacterized protein (TIGR04141 family)